MEEDWKRLDHCLGPKMRINIYVDAHLGQQKPAQCMIFSTLGAKMRINIYVDARFLAPKASQCIILTVLGPNMRINIYVDAHVGPQKPANTLF